MYELVIVITIIGIKELMCCYIFVKLLFGQSANYVDPSDVLVPTVLKPTVSLGLWQPVKTKHTIY